MQDSTDTHSEYVILIVFPLQQWLRERAPMLLYTYIACLVYKYVIYLTMLPINHTRCHRVLRNTELLVESSRLVIYQNLFRGTEEKTAKPSPRIDCTSSSIRTRCFPHTVQNSFRFTHLARSNSTGQDEYDGSVSAVAYFKVSVPETQ